MQIGKEQRGKRYKAWLSESAFGHDQPDVEPLEAKASLLMRDVAREYVRRECPASFMTPLDLAPSWVQESMDEHPVNSIIENEWIALAHRHAEERFPHIAHSTRIALLARDAGISLAHPLVEQAASAKKSALCKHVNRVWTEVANDIKETYPEDSPADWLKLTSLILREINNLTFLWIRAENKFAQFFMYMNNHAIRHEESDVQT